METPETPPQRSRTKQWIAGAAIAGAMLGTAGIAMAQTSDSDQSTPPDPTVASHPGEELLTGDTAAKVAAAAQAAVPDGTIDRVETDAEGSPYEAHMHQADGTRVTVKVDASFNVTTVETDEGHGGPRGGAPDGTQSQTTSARGSSTI